MLLKKILIKIDSFVAIPGYFKKYKPKKGDVVVDAGACFGHFAIPAAKKVGPKGKVIAYEPDEKNCEIFEENIKKNKLNNIVIIRKALHDKNATLNLSLGYDTSRIVEKSENTVKVPATTLDSEMKRLKLKKIDFLKMDIEGAEMEMLKGAKKSLSKIKNMAIACYHRREGTITGNLMKPILEKAGFKVSIEHPIHKTLYAVRN